jgi:hypothetical protein
MHNVIWPPDTILKAISTLLSYPIVLTHSILTNLYKEASLLQRIISAGREVTVGMVWDLTKWILLALLIFGLIIFIGIDTVRRVIFAELEKKSLRAFFSDALFTLLILLIYYLIICIALYLFFTVILPVARSL